MNHKINERRIRNANLSLMALGILSAFNYILALIGSKFVFVLSAFIPQHLIAFGSYAADSTNNPAHYYAFAVLAGAFVAVLIVCSVISFKSKSFIIPGSVIFFCDCIYLLIYVFINYDVLYRNNLIGMTLNLLLHIVCLSYVLFGIKSLRQVNKGSEC